jgi:hypothetical protein
MSVGALVFDETLNPTAYQIAALSSLLCRQGLVMENRLELPLPHPMQAELMPVSGDSARIEYIAALRNDDALLSEVALRYLIALVLNNAPAEQIREFACQARTELNQQRLHLFLQRLGELEQH